MGQRFNRAQNGDQNNDFMNDRKPGFFETLRGGNNSSRGQKSNTFNTYNQPGTANYYGLTSFELDKVKRFFAAVGGRDRAVSFQEFFYFYAMMNPEIKGLKLFDLAERTFMYADTDKDGYLNFDEFLRFYMNRFPGGFPGGFPDIDLSHFENYCQSKQPICNNLFNEPLNTCPPKQVCYPAIEYSTPRTVYKKHQVEYLDDYPRHESSYRVRRSHEPRSRAIDFLDDDYHTSKRSSIRHVPPTRVYSLDRMPTKRRTTIMPRDYIEYY